MPRPPDENLRQMVSVTARFTTEDKARIEAGLRARGESTTSKYLRTLVREDAERRSKGRG